MGPRGDAVLSFDHTVGKVLDALDSLGLADNTLLIISSDNGPVVDDGYNDRAAELLGDHRPWGRFPGRQVQRLRGRHARPVHRPLARTRRREPHFRRPAEPYRPLRLAGRALRSRAARRGRTRQPEPPRDTPRNRLRRGGIRRRHQPLANALGHLRRLEIHRPRATPPARNEATDTEMGNDPAEQLYDLRNDPGERRNVAAGNPGRSPGSRPCSTASRPGRPAPGGDPSALFPPSAVDDTGGGFP